MQARLRLVRARPGGAASWNSRAVALGLALALAAAAWLATANGADAARRDLPSRGLAEAALSRSLAAGSADPEVRGTLLELRRALARRPLDARTRVVYASLLLGLSQSLADTRAAAFHADLAARFAPVTVPVVDPAVMVLARSGAAGRATELIREMFAYDAGAAAELLFRVEGSLFAPQVEAALADTPEAWLAWHWRLLRAGRTEQARATLDEAGRRWPEHLPTLQHRVAAAFDAGALDRAAALLPDDLALPSRAEAAPLFAYRALLRARSGDSAGARDDLDAALRLTPEDPTVLLLAGDTAIAADDPDEARRRWNRALFRLDRDDDERRRALLRRLAVLEDEHGPPATALRLWRALLEIDPDDTRARRRVEDLSGFAP